MTGASDTLFHGLNFKDEKKFIDAAEARAILFGLEVCNKEGCRKIEVESDALNVIKTIEGGDWELSQEGPIFDEIQLIAS